MDKKRLKETLGALEEGLTNLMKSLKPFFKNFSTHRIAGHYLKGLLSAVDRKNNWQIAEKTITEVRNDTTVTFSIPAGFSGGN